MSPGSDELSSSGPCGVSHIAVVTADVDRYRAFYEGVIGLETTMVLGAGPGHARQAVIVAGDVLLHVFEVPGYDPAAQGFAPPMFERGRIDHFGFTVADEPALHEVRDRLLAAGASSGHIRRLGPMLSLRFHDPEGFEGEVNCLDPAYDPSTVRAADEIVEPDWFSRTAHVLRDRRPAAADLSTNAQPGGPASPGVVPRRDP